MTTDTLTHGETYAIAIQALDADGVALALEAGWSAACRICSGRVGGPTAADVAMTLAAGTASGSIDTDPALAPGKYYTDVRFTDPEGNDYWSEPWIINLLTRNTPAS